MILLSSFSRSTERSELLIESEARNAESTEARCAECRFDVALNARAVQADANLGQGCLYIYIYIYIYIIGAKGVTATDPLENAELFNRFFSSVYFTAIGDTHPPAIHVVNLYLLFEINTTSVEVEKVLQNLDSRKATGTDEVPSRILKTLASELSFL